MPRPIFKLPTDQGDSGAWGPKVNAALTAAMSPGLPAFRGLRPVAYHGGIPNNNQAGLSNGTDRVCHTISKHALAAGTITSIVLVFPGLWYANGGTGETDLPNTATYSAMLELPSGTRIPVFFRGLRKVTTDIGSAFAISDPIPVLIRPSDTRHFFVRTRCEVPAAGKFSPNITVSNTVNAGEGTVRGTDESVDLINGTIGTTAGYGVGPMLILGSSSEMSQAICGIEGDSVGNGSGDQLNDLGFLSRIARGLGVPEVKTANGGGTNADSLLPASWRRRLLQIGCTHVIHEGGVNDTRTGTLTLAQLQAQDIAKWRRSNDEGARVLVTTMTPTGTSSTDAYATVENQTILNGTAQTVRVARNNWVRAGAPLNPTTFAPLAAGASGAVTFGQTGHPALGYLEVADLVESARDSGLFGAGYTSDGLHIAAARQIAMAPLLSGAVQAFLETT